MGFTLFKYCKNCFMLTLLPVMLFMKVTNNPRNCLRWSVATRSNGKLVYWYCMLGQKNVVCIWCMQLQGTMGGSSTRKWTAVIVRYMPFLNILAVNMNLVVYLQILKAIKFSEAVIRSVLKQSGLLHARLLVTLANKCWAPCAVLSQPPCRRNRASSLLCLTGEDEE